MPLYCRSLPLRFSEIGTSSNARPRLGTGAARVPAAAGAHRYRPPRTPFCVSSGDAGPVDLALSLHNEREHLACDVAFEAPDCLQLGMAFGDALGHVHLRARIRPQP